MRNLYGKKLKKFNSKILFILPHSSVDTQGEKSWRNETNYGRVLSANDKNSQEDEGKAHEGAAKICQVCAIKKRKTDIYVNKFILHKLEK